MEPVVYALITETHVHYLCANYLRLNVIRPAVIPEYNGPPVLQTRAVMALPLSPPHPFAFSFSPFILSHTDVYPPDTGWIKLILAG